MNAFLDAGSLNVYTEDQTNQMQVLQWNVSGDHGNRWVEGQVSLASANSFQIILEATYGGGPLGDCALDDTLIDVGFLCNSEFHTTCSNHWYHIFRHNGCPRLYAALNLRRRKKYP